MPEIGAVVGMHEAEVDKLDQLARVARAGIVGRIRPADSIGRLADGIALEVLRRGSAAGEEDRNPVRSTRS